jgi:hypothetical protein
LFISLIKSLLSKIETEIKRSYTTYNLLSTVYGPLHTKILGG